MRTITEFAAATLKNASKAKQELVAAGKAAEELAAALGEALKLEGEKLTHLMNALDTVGEKVNDLKRVVVHALSEGEKAPGQQKGEHSYLAEYYAPVRKPGAPAEGERGHGRGGRGDRGGKGGRGKRGERGGRGGERGDRGGKSAGAGGPGGDRPPRGPRPERAPRAPKPHVPANVKPVGAKPAEAAPAEKPAEKTEG